MSYSYYRAILNASLIVLLLLHSSFFCNGLKIDNGIVGQPTLQCMGDVIRFSFRTEKTYKGRIFVKGRSNDPDCVQNFPDNTVPNATYLVQLGACGMQKLERAMPFEGTGMTITLVVSFHRIFVTKVDRAYQIQCFFNPEAVTVTQDLGVSMVPVTRLEVGADQVRCSYEIRRGSPDGEKVAYTTVGEKVFHVWECTTGDQLSTSSYGLLISGCTAQDPGSLQPVEIVDENGCVKDPVLMEPLTYDGQRLRAFSTTHVYKYADQPSIRYRCGIRLCSRLSGQCNGVTPPVCNRRKASLFGRVLHRRLKFHNVLKRQKRQSLENNHKEDSPLLTADIEDELDSVFAVGEGVTLANYSNPVEASESTFASTPDPGLLNELPRFSVNSDEMVIFDPAIDFAGTETALTNQAARQFNQELVAAEGTFREVPVYDDFVTEQQLDSNYVGNGNGLPLRAERPGPRMVPYYMMYPPPPYAGTQQPFPPGPYSGRGGKRPVFTHVPEPEVTTEESTAPSTDGLTTNGLYQAVRKATKEIFRSHSEIPTSHQTTVKAKSFYHNDDENGHSRSHEIHEVEEKEPRNPQLTCMQTVTYHFMAATTLSAFVLSIVFSILLLIRLGGFSCCDVVRQRIPDGTHRNAQRTIWPYCLPNRWTWWNMAAAWQNDRQNTTVFLENQRPMYSPSSLAASTNTLFNGGNGFDGGKTSSLNERL